MEFGTMFIEFLAQAPETVTLVPHLAGSAVFLLLFAFLGVKSVGSHSSTAQLFPATLFACGVTTCFALSVIFHGVSQRVKRLANVC